MLPPLPSGSSTWSRLAGQGFPRVARQAFDTAAAAATAEDSSDENEVERLRLQLLYAQNELLQVTIQCGSKKSFRSFIWKLDNITTQPYFTEGWEPLELSLVFNPDPSQLSLVMKNNQVYPNIMIMIIMKSFNKNNPTKQKKSIILTCLLQVPMTRKSARWVCWTGGG